MFTHREMTPEAFLAYAEQHADKKFDFIDGEMMVEVSPKPLHGRQQVLFAVAFEAYTQQHPVGVVYVEVLHVLNDEKFIPDVCINAASTADYLTTPPRVAVEIQSESQSRESQRRKARAHLAAGVPLVILVMPAESVEVYRQGQPVGVLTAADTLDGGDVLPGFRMALQAVLGGR